MRVDLYGKQFDFLQDEHKFIAFVGGVGSGKTIVGSTRALVAAMGQVGGLKIAAPNMGMVTAPTYNVLRDATVPAFCHIAGELIESITQAPPIDARLINGSVIMFRSAHKPDLLRGPSISWWWGDEAALYHRSVWSIMIGRLREHGDLGYCWLTTTPKGRNWIYREFVQKRRAQYAIHKAATWQNPFIGAEYYQVLSGSYAGEFARQELEGEFVAFEGLVYSEFDRDQHVRRQHAGAFKLVIAGVDWGYANPGVIVVYGVDTDGRMWGLHEEYAPRRRVEEWAALAAQLQARYAIDMFKCDPSQPDFITLFQQAGVNAQPANNEVLTGIQAVKNRLGRQGDGLPRLVLSYEFVQTAAEFEQYQWMEHRDGLKDAPKKVNDHAMDATRYAVMGADELFGWDAIGSMRYADDAISGSTY